MSSRTGWITNILIHLLFIIFQIKNKSLKAVHILFGLGILSSFFLINQIPVTKHRFNEVVKNTLETKKEDNISSPKPLKPKPPSSTNTRKKAWETSFEIIKKHLIFGTGLGKSKEILNLAYESKGYDSLKDKSINSHNEYIQYQLDHGLIGSVFLFFFTFIMLVLSLREKDILYGLFLLIIIINFMTESMLETQSGVVFFSFFNTLFFYNWIDKKLKKID